MQAQLFLGMTGYSTRTTFAGRNLRSARWGGEVVAERQDSRCSCGSGLGLRVAIVAHLRCDANCHSFRFASSQYAHCQFFLFFVVFFFKRPGNQEKQTHLNIKNNNNNLPRGSAASASMEIKLYERVEIFASDISRPLYS
jgi:hypothetical protein